MTEPQHPARPERKGFTLALKEAPGEGKVRAIISTFNTRDRDGDIMMPSAFANSSGKSVPMVWSHDWDKPIGKGTIEVTPTEAVFNGEFFLDTSHGAEAFKTVRAMGDLQEYSIGFRVVESEWEQDNNEWTRKINDIELFEASPVLVGAAYGTRTLDIKSHGGDDAVIDAALKALAKRDLERVHAATQIVLSIHSDNCNMGEDCPMYVKADDADKAVQQEVVRKDAERARAQIALLELEVA